jgi:signal transduction histidine kinase
MRITSFREDREGSMWIGTLGGGINLYDARNNSFKRFMHDPEDEASVSSNDITSIENSTGASLWVGTVSSGLNLFDRTRSDFVRYSSDPADPQSLASDNVYSLFTDRGGVLWVGAGGLNMFNPGLLRFGCSEAPGILRDHLEGKSIYALLEDSKGQIWAGSYHDGVARLDPETSRVKWYTLHDGNSNSISSNSITAMAEDREGNIWISTAGSGLNRLDPDKGKWTRFRENKEQSETAGLDHISGIVVDDEGCVWIATSDQGIICYHPDSDSYHSYRTDVDDPSSLSGNYLLRLFKDGQGDIWVGTWGAGLNRFEGEEKGFTRFMSEPTDPASLPDNIVHSIYEQDLDTARLIWVGTANGLAYIDPDEPGKGFMPSAANRELPSHSVYGTLIDQRGQCWISTNAGISVFNSKDSILKHYTHRDGLPGNEYNAGAFLELSQGLFAFGGIAGLLVFHPDSVGESTFQPEVALTSFSILNEQIYLGIDLNAMESITLSHRQNFFSFEFASMDFSDQQKNRFMYTLEGIDGDWISSGDRNFASYTKIDPGNYLFRVRGTNSDGIWSGKENVIHLSITPPFWQRWWFRGTLIAIVLLAFYAIHLYRIRRVREIERLRTRIASDLHDDIGSALTRISVHSQQIMSQEELGIIRRSTGKINELSREMVSTMSDIVWSIDARNDTLADFLSRMQDLIHSLLSDQDIHVSFRHKGMDVRRPLKVHVRQNLYYIFKEAIHNIAKHSGADQVEIEIENTHSGFRMKISDNGSGYDPGSVKGGNGIRNMQMRAGRIGASLKILSVSGVVIVLKMKGL